MDITEVKELLGHSPVVYLRGMLGYCLLLFVVYVGYAVRHYYQPDVGYLKRIIAVIGLFLFVRWVVSFLNLYLDCLLLSQQTLTVFLWDGLLEYRTEVLDWSKITTISYRQNSLGDRIFGKGDIIIQLGNAIDFYFSDVSFPKKAVTKLLLFKKNYEDEQKIKIDEDLAGDKKHMEILVDALGEIVKEYMEERTAYGGFLERNEEVEIDEE